jgi:hypothetical protein
MLKKSVKVMSALTIAVLVIGAVYIEGMRRKSPRVRNVVRRIARASQRFTIASAGTPGAYASVVKHVGRTSGRDYETPVRAAATEDGFVITLPYGSNTDWLKNVMHAGSATLVNNGDEANVERPEVVRRDGAFEAFDAKDQRVQRLFGVDEYLRVHRV